MSQQATISAVALEYINRGQPVPGSLHGDLFSPSESPLQRIEQEILPHIQNDVSKLEALVLTIINSPFILFWCRHLPMRLNFMNMITRYPSILRCPSFPDLVSYLRWEELVAFVRWIMSNSVLQQLPQETQQAIVGKIVNYSKEVDWAPLSAIGSSERGLLSIFLLEHDRWEEVIEKARSFVVPDALESTIYYELNSYPARNHLPVITRVMKVYCATHRKSALYYLLELLDKRSISSEDCRQICKAIGVRFSEILKLQASSS